MRAMNMRTGRAIALGMIVATCLAAPADARRGGSFGSRGGRTYSAPSATGIAPRPVAPVQRSMTQRSANQQAGGQQIGRAAPARSGGMMRGLIGGLIAGGLIGALLGHGFGSMAGAGFLMAILQIVLIGGLIWFLFRMFGRRRATAPAFAGGQGAAFASMEPRQSFTSQQPWGSTSVPAAAPVGDIEIDIDERDKEAFERLLVEVQDAFGREDYARLRERTTPEIMSYFAEELSQNATSGRRNQVSGTTLLDAEVSEAWREGSTDYATIAMRYESVDVMLNRSSGAVLSGSASVPTQATELWTFMRDAGGAWRVSAVQEA
jgi:predicted lipid-binding transport protein (Tim44 family)